MLRNLKVVTFLFFCLAVVFLILVIGIIYFIKNKKNIKSKKVRVVGYIISGVVGITIISYVLFEGIYVYHMYTNKNVNNVGNYKYEIILGGGLNGDKPGPMLENRLNLGIEYLNLHKDTKVIVSGGQGSNEEVSEALAMRNYLMEHGINKDRILEDNKSKNTVQNIAFSKKILEEQGAINDTALIVTDDFHLYRAELIANELGVKNTGIGCKSDWKVSLTYTILAFPNTIKSLIDGLKYI
ncbi:MAG: YdcF family protein [Clostridium sp.]|uniref:YdcF family protein n=1 Tax=Clostridium sp. TaxID=1506 RepID=UPI003F30710F